MDDNIDRLREEIAQREAELAGLKSRLAAAEQSRQQQQQQQQQHHHHHHRQHVEPWKWPLEALEYQRYGRQMIVPKFGLEAQLRLKKARVLLVGAGGLGCPAAAYLAGSGVGALGLVDGDTVELSNLHRQVAHSTSRVGMSKTESAIAFLRDLNAGVTYEGHGVHLTADNAEDIVSRYDLVLDCTDRPASRYLISDICVLLGKPLISASAFQTSGQLIVLNSPPGRGPCYRCVFPKPPPPETVVGCGEGGIIGPVVGVMGVLQALEAVKLICRGGPEAGLEASPDEERHHHQQQQQQHTMLLFSGMADHCPFRSVRMRGKRQGCFSCSENPQLTADYLKTAMDYVQFCGSTRPVQLLPRQERISAQEYRLLSERGTKHVLLDVREREHFHLAHIPGSINVPMSRFTSLGSRDALPEEFPRDLPAHVPVYVVCRVGNDSQVAARRLKELGLSRNGERFVGDIVGGLRSWKDTVDGSLPFL
ncbi:uncharacterized protein UV8b_03614 [Ustilaginoidea virens]|uniref:Adenylyltransferase and sulfurtransferase uba4 n=1 Tax=Ustilaginoidea virens TaxID=1159556 RepID=A0A8E5HQ81_USTVR|nr:uncharacterized protein UV8b_03614 [Ustilaginoidea virens]QUC19373.1 hypothetical protein UV8b_03614 [Ustilaginoidea virens]